MKLVQRRDFHGVEHLIRKKKLGTWLDGLLDAPSIIVGRGCTDEIRSHLRDQLTLKGWSDETKLDPELKITIFSTGADFVFQVQTGNISRAFYDLLKFQALYLDRRVDAAILVVPSEAAAKAIGSNIASFDRLVRETDYFDRVISVPMVVLAFE